MVGVRRERRRLSSKSGRTALFLSQGGKCAICGGALDPDNWHADHIVPWHATHRTNIHEMQALCPKCNLVKGGRNVP